MARLGFRWAPHFRMLSMGTGLTLPAQGPEEPVTVPAQFAAGGWSMSDLGTGGDVRITIATLPDDGGSAITDLEYRIDAGAAQSLAAVVTGDYTVSDLTDDLQISVQVRAVNAVGNGEWSAAKTVTPTTFVPPVEYTPTYHYLGF